MEKQLNIEWPQERVLVWFSCGAASAVASKLAIEKYGKETVKIVYCDVMSAENPDNQRFFDDVQRWVEHPIEKIKSGQYDSVDDVFEKTRYMAGINGARCTVEMKKMPRFAFQRPRDIHIFGFTHEESGRIDRFRKNHPDLKLDFILHDQQVSKDDCHQMITEAGIDTPAMYMLGYKNNNCIGCVKATIANYWNMILRDFPDIFDKRAKQSREIGVRLTRYKGERVFIDEIPVDYMPAEPLEDISCGPDCGEA